ncbi:2OG-Fe(II) oxygenase family oxidoreductase [Aspergillus nomiae NRRL 13137]|uniref:2OG-Fe(II) oxygenase family oxidoreductase n=1 Tax=Aspergillus nomiae NRRL (strain ATCC 15546 / NRRL 13137 / CBS 260.88 / M93) TaxID=1509407 RepID=A0A0L1JF67_ASPN3|nr:2OG-Fe(II) oxygenase family oxidoreductase [Aspergillus nomiae NRRL 13137]KNG90342.1 2OG-Fe(II) oxygenase family oxidoreductase [Aspergillus nomiae NRRL 13137]
MSSVQSSETQNDFSIAPLPTIDHARLEAKDGEETQRLLDACKTHGFFYLDLRKVGTVLNDWQQVLRIMEKYFSQDLMTKMKDDRRSDTYGSSYEPCGTSAGAVPGTLDFYETLKIARSEMYEKSASLPQTAKDNLELFDRFIRAADTITTTILARLSDAFNLCSGLRFEDKHRPGGKSRSTLTLFRYPKQEVQENKVGHNKHTDIGTLTLLFSEQWGLQVLSPETSEWSFVAPKKDHAVINVGDSLRFLSGNVLKSCVHRVVPRNVSGRQEEHRYSIAYFLRAEDVVQYKDSKGRVISARDWHDEKYEVFRLSHDESNSDRILTGGMEKGGQFIVPNISQDE